MKKYVLYQHEGDDEGRKMSRFVCEVGLRRIIGPWYRYSRGFGIYYAITLYTRERYYDQYKFRDPFYHFITLVREAAPYKEGDCFETINLPAGTIWSTTLPVSQGDHYSILERFARSMEMGYFAEGKSAPF